jgi:hypothetical protein
MDFMRPTYRFKIKTVAVSDNFKPLVNKNIMNDKIGHPIQRNTNANEKKIIVIVFYSKKQ